MGFARDILDWLIVPSNFLILLFVAGFVLLLLHRRGAAIAALSLSLGGFLVFGYTSAGELLIAPLVERFPPHDFASEDVPDGLIVLNSDLNEVHAQAMGTPIEFADGGEVIVTAALLAQRFPDARILLAGGSNLPPPFREADGMERVLTEFGVAPDRIWIDGTASGTVQAAENIVEEIGAAQDGAWWLIAPAHRMPRTVGTFRAAGLDPVAVPVDYRWIPPFDPTYIYGFRNGMTMTDAAVHEWAGLLVYHLQDRTDAFLPAPR